MTPQPNPTDLGELVARLRAVTMLPVICGRAADAIATLQAERDALKAERDELKQPKEKRAPVQGWAEGIPWDMHLRAYEGYCKKWSPQPALIDLEGRGCRGGFGTEELDMFIPGWRDELSERAAIQARAEKAEAEVAALKAKLERAVEALHDISTWREDCHANDADLDHELRDFGEEDFGNIEAFAATVHAELTQQEIKS